MKTLRLYDQDVPRLALGCMRYADKPQARITEVIETATSLGLHFFDHANIYGGGESETVFGRALKASSVAREDLILQTKCGIHDGMYNFEPEHIRDEVEGSLKRLDTDYVDILLLHRPDTLMEPDRIAETFMTLREAGKVRHFGVSNFTPMQMELLQQALDDAGFGEKLAVNQVQISLEHALLIDEEIRFNLKDTASHTQGLLSYARLRGITLQAWSPLQYGFIEGDFITESQHDELASTLDELAATYEATPAAIALAWLLRHPAKIQPVLGSTSPDHIREAAEALRIELTRPEWYRLYKAAGHELP